MPIVNITQVTWLLRFSRNKYTLYLVCYFDLIIINKESGSYNNERPNFFSFGRWLKKKKKKKNGENYFPVSFAKKNNLKSEMFLY